MGPEKAALFGINRDSSNSLPRPSYLSHMGMHVAPRSNRSRQPIPEKPLPTLIQAQICLKFAPPTTQTPRQPIFFANPPVKTARFRVGPLLEPFFNSGLRFLHNPGSTSGPAKKAIPKSNSTWWESESQEKVGGSKECGTQEKVGGASGRRPVGAGLVPAR